MKNPLLLDVSDAHLCDLIWGGYPELTGDAYWGFQQTVDLAIEAGVAAVISNGDLLNAGRPNSRPVIFYQSEAERLRQAEIALWFIDGQHELDDPPWATHPGAVHLDGQIGTLGPLRITGLDFQPAGRLDEALQQLPEADVLVAHQAWQEFMSAETSQGSLTQIPGVRLVLTGDLHEFREWRGSGRDGQALRVVSPGATHRRKINEPDEHFVLLLDEDLVIERIPLKTRRFLRSGALQDPVQFDEFLAGLEQQLTAAWDQTTGYPEAVRKPVVHVRYHADIPEVRHRLAAAVGQRAFVYPQEFRAAAPQSAEAFAARTAAVAGGLLGCLPEIADPSSQVYSDLHRLATADSVKLEFTNLEREHYGEELAAEETAARLAEAAAGSGHDPLGEFT